MDLLTFSIYLLEIDIVTMIIMPTPTQINLALTYGEDVILHGWFCFGNTTSKVRLDLEDESNLWEEYRSVTLVSQKGLLVFLNKHFLIFCKTLATPRALIYFYMILSSFMIVFGEICWVTHSILSKILQKCLSLFLPIDLCYFWWL